MGNSVQSFVDAYTVLFIVTFMLTRKVGVERRELERENRQKCSRDFLRLPLRFEETVSDSFLIPLDQE